MNQYPLEVFGVIGPMMSMPYIEKGHGGAMTYSSCHNDFPLRLGGLPKIKNGVATDLFCTGVIGHPRYIFLN